MRLESVLTAIETLKRQLTAGDLASHLGIPIRHSNQELARLCTNCGGHIEGGKGASAVFVFPKNFRTILFARYWQYRLRYLLQRAWDLFVRIFRFSFGLAVFISIALLFITIAVFLVFIAKGKGRVPRIPGDGGEVEVGGGGGWDGGGGGGGGSGAGFNAGHGWLYLLLNSTATSPHHNHPLHPHSYVPHDDKNDHNNTPDEEGGGGGGDGDSDPEDLEGSSPDDNNNNNNNEEMGLVNAIYSFVFGDSFLCPSSSTSSSSSSVVDSSNSKDLETRRYKAIASLIRRNDGVVIAEQLAPYLDSCILDCDNNSEKEIGGGGKYRHEEYVLPVLAAFGGEPHASDDGMLVYHVPQLQHSASQYGNKRSFGPPIFEEEIKFSSVPHKQIWTVVGLGLANLVGIAIVGYLVTYHADIIQAIISSRGGAGEFGSIIVSITTLLYPVLLVYGVLYFVIPGIRYPCVLLLNRFIRARNEQRKDSVAVLQRENRTSREIAEKMEFRLQFVRQLQREFLLE